MFFSSIYVEESLLLPQNDACDVHISDLLLSSHHYKNTVTAQTSIKSQGKPWLSSLYSIYI